MMSGRITTLVLGFFALATVITACNDDSDGVSPGQDTEQPVAREDITQAFSATTLNTTTDGTTTDQLAQGATLEITLYEDGTTTGNLFIPGDDEVDADLSGTFTFNDTTDGVSFDQSADTFVRDMTFTAFKSNDSVRLEGEETFSGTTVEVVLE